jgi:ATP-dependent exoDNAse (exonuclease V) alpha subunit
MALTAAYAFTDDKAQGQPMECVLVDLGKLPTGGLNRFNVYIALSRSLGRKTIRLLREFDAKLFTEHPSERLREEDVRLSILENQTL